MKIGPIPGVGLENYKKTNLRPIRAEKAPFTPDTLEISGESRLFAQALKAAMESPADRMDKVSVIKQQIADGSYSPDSAAIAEKMLMGVVKPKM